MKPSLSAFVNIGLTLAGILLVCLSLMAQPAKSQTIEHLILAGNYRQALTHIDAALNAGHKDANLFLMRGYALSGIGAIDEAQRTVKFARNATSRFNYFTLRGQVFGQKGDHNRALFWYRRALDIAQNPSEEKVARQMLTFNSSARKWVWGAQFNLRRSDNINFGTSKTEVKLGGLPFKLHESNRAQPGLALIGIFSAEYKLVSTPTGLLQIGPSVSFVHSPKNGLQSRSIGFKIKGEKVIKSKKYSVISYGFDLGKTFPVAGTVSESRKASLGFRRALSARTTGFASLSIQKNNQIAADHTIRALGFGVGHKSKNGHTSSLRLRKEIISSRNANVAANVVGLGASFTPNIKSLPVSISLFVDAEQRGFTQLTPFFGGYREDVTTSFGVNISAKEFTIMGMTPTVTFKSVNRRSNMALNSANAREVYFNLKNKF